MPSPDTEGWTHNIPTDDGHEMDEVFSFDGHSTALEVPESVFNHVLHKRFTISAWLRHDASQVSYPQAKSPKEHIVCMSDGDGKPKLVLFYYLIFIIQFDIFFAPSLPFFFFLLLFFMDNVIPAFSLLSPNEKDQMH